MPDRRLKRSRRTASPPRKPRPVKPARLDLGVLDGHLGYFIRRLQVWVFQDFIRALAAIDIRPAQYSVLVVITANPGASQSQIAAALGIERARLARLLHKLERRGLVERLQSPSDARSHALRLTRDGSRTLRRAKTLAAMHETRLAETLGPERRKLILDWLRETGR
jgi:DNA-binding MarR family transcriptional regulator